MTNVLDEIKYADVKKVDTEIDNLIQNNYDMALVGKCECKEHINDNNITKLFITKSLLTDDNNLVKEIDNIREFVSVILTNSDVLKTYGGWVGIKKYQVE